MARKLRRRPITIQIKRRSDQNPSPPCSSAHYILLPPGLPALFLNGDGKIGRPFSTKDAACIC
ncbi:hypothetical protein CLOSTASPAR_00350 [[Clostridium] asparagiforme DSM 15981]|uniref:Uncharacterized protein n=1 Tax=[Clostridium] asparagiforme DSM 15981 TaxID=518636 RepID=C0CTQ2_9FIRM|nr:hypothetical protein CLOSTASPAR_00350 [[Clostridium] asparagiforme DSM 15981]